MSICLLDTSIFCNVLMVPGRCADQEEIVGEMESKIELGESLLLPLATIIETGNHIAHCPRGDQRRRAAKRLVDSIKAAAEGRAPWTPTRPLDIQEMLKWIDSFPGYAIKDASLADLTIIKEFDYFRELHPNRHIYIWSLDKHLRGYDRPEKKPGHGKRG